MCGRFSLAVAPERLQQHFQLKMGTLATLQPRYNIAPAQPLLQRQATQFRWGLIPRWSRTPKAGLINARAETVAEKPSFRQAFCRRRCLSRQMASTSGPTRARPSGSPTGFTCWIDRCLPLPAFGSAGAAHKGWREKLAPSLTRQPIG